MRKHAMPWLLEIWVLLVTLFSANILYHVSVIMKQISPGKDFLLLGLRILKLVIYLNLPVKHFMSSQYKILILYCLPLLFKEKCIQLSIFQVAWTQDNFAMTFWTLSNVNSYSSKIALYKQFYNFSVQYVLFLAT